MIKAEHGIHSLRVRPIREQALTRGHAAPCLQSPEAHILLMREPHRIIFIGGGGHARVLAEIIDLMKAGHIFGYVDLHHTDRFEYPYLGDDSALDSFPPDGCLLVNGLGSVHLPVKRCDIFRRLSARGYRFMNVIHPRAVISPGALLRDGVQVLAGAVINPGVTIGENCLINTGAVIDHDCTIDRHCHIAPGAVLSGSVRVGEGSHIGTGATVVQGIEIGCRVLIGAGSVVVSNIPDGCKAFGIPARPQGLSEKTATQRSRHVDDPNHTAA